MLPINSYKVINMSDYIRLAADYSSTGLWNEDGVNIDPPAELSATTLAVLKAWCQLYETNDDYLEDADRKTPHFDLAAFAEQGYQVARLIKQDLPGYEVWYFDEHKALTSQSYRWEYEFLITLEGNV
jgi:hypothetical protein